MRRAVVLAAVVIAAVVVAGSAHATVRLLGSTPLVGRSQIALIMIGAAGGARCSLELPSALRGPGVTVPAAIREPAGGLQWRWRVSSRLGIFTARVDCGAQGTIRVPIHITAKGRINGGLHGGGDSLPIVPTDGP